jgi:hypothetical protein
MGRLGGALIGAGFFVWIAGTRALDPGEIGWLMRYDWPIHFFGWHFFRSEPWQWPPGLIQTYYAPLGTAIGFTDSIPLAAFLLKPLASWLPPVFQYIGLWLLACFALQGAFGAWLIAQWTPRPALQAVGATLFVLMPALLVRIGHPALCTHWLLLWALVIAARAPAARPRVWEWTSIGLIAGLVHPYLAVMVLALLAGVAATASPLPWRGRLRALAGSAAATLGGWWMSGLFSVAGAEALATEGLGHYSMNLLGPVTPAGWSLFLPDIPRATPGQDFEGFQYLGLGVLALLALAVGLHWRRATGERPLVVGGPVVAAAVLMAACSLSPKVTAASAVLVDLTGPLTEHFAVFRATGRFFWPLAYLVVAWSIASVVRWWPHRLAWGVLVSVVTLQALDLHGAHEERRRTARDPAFYEWSHTMRSPAWSRILPHYAHLVLYPPPQCGPSPVPYEPAALLAGRHGLTLNAGVVARPDAAARLRYCHGLGDAVKGGVIDDQSLYIVPASEVDAIRKAARAPLVCGAIEAVPICVTAASYQRWRDAAELK